MLILDYIDHVVVIGLLGRLGRLVDQELQLSGDLLDSSFYIAHLGGDIVVLAEPLLLFRLFSVYLAAPCSNNLFGQIGHFCSPCLDRRRHHPDENPRNQGIDL